MSSAPSDPSSKDPPPEEGEIAGIIPKPPGTRELTPRALIAGAVVALVMGASYPYIVMKLGFGPNVSVVSAFFGYLSLGIIFRTFNRWENNIVQTAGTSAAQTAFMCIILGAFDLLRQNPALNYTFAPTEVQSFIWLTVASVLGLLLAVPLRRHYVVDEKLRYADGLAAAQTIVVLDGRGAEARNPAVALAIGLVIAGAVFFLQTPWGGTHIPEVIFVTMFGLAYSGVGAGFATGLLSLGSGMIIGIRICLSMAIGSVLSWIIAPHFLVSEGIIKTVIGADGEPNVTRLSVLRWVMWPAVAMLICAGLTSLFLKWRTLARTFKDLSTGPENEEEFPLRWVTIGVALASIALVAVQIWIFQLPWWAPLVSVVLSVPLMLVGLRVLGETNWGPISQLTNLMQVAFASLLPGNITANLATSGTTGTIATQSEAIMQDYKAGHLIGSKPRYLTYAQLFAAPIGAAAVAWMYPLLRDTYNGVGSASLPAPISVRLASFAEFLTQGGDAMGKYAAGVAVVFGVVGIAMAIAEQNPKIRKVMPSPTAIGTGMVIPGSAVFTMLIGAAIHWFWEKKRPKAAARYSAPLASGVIAGEAIVGVLIPLLVATGVLAAMEPEEKPKTPPAASAPAPASAPAASPSAPSEAPTGQPATPAPAPVPSAPGPSEAPASAPSAPSDSTPSAPSAPSAPPAPPAPPGAQ